MSEWVLSVCAMVFLTAVLNALIPQGKTGKIIKSVFALMCLIVLIKPVLSLKNAEFDFTAAFSSSNINLQDDYLEYTLKQKGDFLGKDLIEYLNNDGIDVEQANIELYYKDDFNISTKKVSVRLKNGVMIDDSAHIDIIEKVFGYLSARV